jgi:hypothetical protein
MKYLIAVAFLLLAAPVLACPGKVPQNAAAPHVEPMSVDRAVATQGPKG